jgi:hypothetical protein
MSEAHSIERMSDEAFGWYVSGFVDGEGFFLCNAMRNHSHNPKFSPGYVRQWAVRFGIKLRADDGAGLRAIAARMGVGLIQARKVIRQDNPQINWVVNRQADLMNVIIPHFERFPLQMKKARDFAIWKECVKTMYEKNKRPWPAGKVGGRPTLTDDELEFMHKAVQQLKEIRRFESMGIPVTPVRPVVPTNTGLSLFDQDLM